MFEYVKTEKHMKAACTREQKSSDKLNWAAAVFIDCVSFIWVRGKTRINASDGSGSWSGALLHKHWSSRAERVNPDSTESLEIHWFTS